MMALLPLLLGGCSLLGFDGSNTMRATGDAPFHLGKVVSALWAESAWSEPEEGDGEGLLLLTSAELSCDDLMAELDGEVEPRDSVIWTSEGIAVELEWYDPAERNAGFTGTYVSGMYPLGGYYEGGDTLRVFRLTAFADGTTWEDYYGLGRADVDDYDDSDVRGSLRTNWVKANFQAEHCGQQQGWSDYNDTGWYYDVR